MNEGKVIELMLKHAEKQFPKTCLNCGMVFSSLAEYIKSTFRVGDPISYDVEMEDWEPEQPIGTAFYVNCKCGSTLSLSSQGMDLLTLIRLMAWFRLEAGKRGVSTGQLLTHIRSKIRNSALSK